MASRRSTLSCYPVSDIILLNLYKRIIRKKKKTEKKEEEKRSRFDWQQESFQTREKNVFRILTLWSQYSAIAQIETWKLCKERRYRRDEENLLRVDSLQHLGQEEVGRCRQLSHCEILIHKQVRLGAMRPPRRCSYCSKQEPLHRCFNYAATVAAHKSACSTLHWPAVCFGQICCQSQEYGQVSMKWIHSSWYTSSQMAIDVPALKRSFIITGSSKAALVKGYS